MQFSEQWLREWVNPKISRDDLIHQLTMAGLEVDGFEAVAGEFSKVVVGEVKFLTTKRWPRFSLALSGFVRVSAGTVRARAAPWQMATLGMTSAGPR